MCSDLQLAQRVPELSAAAFGERDVDFEGIDIWDEEVMDLLDSQKLDTLRDDSDADDLEALGVAQDEDIYDEAI